MPAFLAKALTSRPSAPHPSAVMSGAGTRSRKRHVGFALIVKNSCRLGGPPFLPLVTHLIDTCAMNVAISGANAAACHLLNDSVFWE